VPIAGAHSEVPGPFRVGDALELAEPNCSFDIARSERTLQWLTDPKAAVAEMAGYYARRLLSSSIPTGRRSTSTSATGDLAKRVLDACGSSDADRPTSATAR